uniref:C20G8.02-like WWE domain-containing protein n=1 Tax=Schistocephalus solidus TaxID=70667 RepID=A0A0X3NVM8_SCHSO
MTFNPFSLPPENVRWFFGPAGLDTSKYEPFRGYDSIRLETKFRESVIQQFSDESLAELVVVRDDLFEANITEGTCLPIYWESERMTVTSDSSTWMKSVLIRGTWFRTETWQPIPEKLSKAIDAIYCNDILNKLSQVASTNKKVQIMQSLQVDGGFVRFMDDGKVFLDKNATLYYFRSKFTLKNGIQLSRGYKEVANIEDKSPDISHLVFVVHGIGQTFGSIKSDNWKIRNVSANCFAKNFGSNGQRTEFLPVEWRTSLELDESVIHSVTLAHCHPFRVLLNSSALDILYYTSPVHRMEIMRAFYHEVTRLYSMFCSRNPYFEGNGGKVSILAHSLGAVVAFDVLTGSTPSSSATTYFQSIHTH